MSAYKPYPCPACLKEFGLDDAYAPESLAEAHQSQHLALVAASYPRVLAKGELAEHRRAQREQFARERGVA